MSEVRIYTTTACGYCVAAKRLLGKRGIAFVEEDVTGNADKRQWLVATTGRRTVPQIFIGDKSIGGYEELAALDREGRLESMLGDAIGPS